MTPDWTHSVDVDRLAATRGAHEFALPLAQMIRLGERLLQRDGVATGSVLFSRERGMNLATLEVVATAHLRCQRCMQAVQVPLHSKGRIALVDDLVAEEALPADAEQFLVSAGRLLLRDLVEEELLLGLPLIARHQDVHCADTLLGEQASAESAQQGAPRRIETTQKPFAGLGELLKHR